MATIYIILAIEVVVVGIDTFLGVYKVINETEWIISGSTILVVIIITVTVGVVRVFILRKSI